MPENPLTTSTIDLSKLWTRINVNAQPALDALGTIQSVREQLRIQLASNVFAESCMLHVPPTIKPSASMSSDELIELWRDLILAAFDAACLEHLIKCLKVTIGTDELVC